MNAICVLRVPFKYESKYVWFVYSRYSSEQRPLVRHKRDAEHIHSKVRPRFQRISVAYTATISQLQSLAHLNQHTQLEWCMRIYIIGFSEYTREPLIIKVLMIGEQFCSLLFYKTEKEENLLRLTSPVPAIQDCII